ncbi:MAG: hypothetical protein ACE5D0_10225, partial [Fidelibacterota bacterium]
MVALIKRKTPIVTPGPKDKPSTSKLVGLTEVKYITKYQPTDIDKKMQNNGSPMPEFTTDADRNYFLAVFKKHSLSQVEAQVGLDINEKDFKRIVSSLSQ